MMSLVLAPGVKISLTPGLFSSAMSSSGTMPPPNTGMSPAPLLLQQLEHAREQLLCAPERIDSADRVHVLLDRRRDDHLGSLVQARVDHLEARVAQGARDDLRAAVVPVEAEFRRPGF